MRPIERFAGGPTAPALLQALGEQYIVHGNATLAAALAKVVRLEEHAPGTQLIEQGNADDHIFFILIGEVAIVINGQEVAHRKAGQQVGEMALLSPGALRSASIFARDTVVTALVTETEFTAVATAHPEAWRRVAAELGDRLRQRTRFIRQRNDTPILFIGSSRESLPVVEALVGRWKAPPFIVRPWTGGVFSPSQFPIDDLARQLAVCDFAALVLGPDDQVLSRGTTSNAPRDNVLFELGLFMGAIERARTLFIVPLDEDIKIPSDILGLNPLRYVSRAGSLEANLAPVCGEIELLIQRLGPR
ncbi:MAG: nucleotide-binding protein [Xanthomonadales bacterium]|nr:nucleotide-binding protein [Xanthomonadales bacterium]